MTSEEWIIGKGKVDECVYIHALDNAEYEFCW
jgi:hypothetical protein